MPKVHIINNCDYMRQNILYKYIITNAVVKYISRAAVPGVADVIESIILPFINPEIHS